MVRRYGNLYAEITTLENLYRAYRKAAKGKRSQCDVAEFEYNLESNLLRLQEEMLEHIYRPGAYHSFYIHDPKRRLISAAPFRDRVVHHALCRVIEPLFERSFIADSYANRVGKGVHVALDRAQAWARSYPYVLQCDLRQFFPSIDHAVLLKVLERKLADEDVLTLCRLILDSGRDVLIREYEMVYFPGDDLFAGLRPRGLPIGNLTSQFWANVYLNELDQFIKRELRCHAYLRYVDDFLLFSDSRSQLWGWKDAVRSKLAGLRLTLHERESTVYRVTNGIPFLGFRIYPAYRRLKRCNGVAFVRRYRGLRRAAEEGRLALSDLQRRIQGWIAHVKHGDTYRLRRALLHPVIRGPLGVMP